MKHFIYFFPLLILLFTGCTFSAIPGNGNLTAESQELKEFNDFSAMGAFKIEYIPSNEYKIEVFIDENLHEYVEINNRSKRLTIKSKKNIGPSKDALIRIYAPHLEKIQVSGAVELFSQANFRSKKLDIDLSGASNVDLIFDAKFLMINNSGASKMRVRGNADQARIDLSGACFFEGAEFRVNDLQLNSTGASKVRVWAVSKLNVMGSGASQIQYKGEPAKLKTEITGASSISSF